MNRNLLLVPVLVAPTMVTSQAFGQTSANPPARLVELPAKTNLNQVRVSARFGYNLTAHLQNVGVPASQAFRPPRPNDPNDPTRSFESATGVTYLDGYVGIDQYGNAPLPDKPEEPRGWYWGYASANQIADGNLLLAHSSSGSIFKDFRNDPQPGFELNYARQMGDRDGNTWGFETGFTFTSLDLRSRGIADSSIMGVDAFPLGGIVPPAAPYYGQFHYEPPGAPSIVTEPRSHNVTIDTSYDASIYGLKVGPYFEFPLAKRLSFAVSGGFSLLLADTEFRVQQKVPVPSPAFPSGTFTDSDFTALPGAYVAGRLSLMASDKVNVFTGMAYESNGRHSQTLAGKRIEIDFYNAIYWTFGVSYSF